MGTFDTMRLPVAHDVNAPDGADVRNIFVLDGGGLAVFELPPGRTSVAGKHLRDQQLVAGRRYLASID